MNKQDTWLKNDLSSEYLRWESREFSRAWLWAAIIFLIVFSCGVFYFFWTKLYFSLPAGIIGGGIPALLYYTGTRSGFNRLPKKIKWSQKGIRYISRDGKETIIPWGSVIHLEVMPRQMLLGEKWRTTT